MRKLNAIHVALGLVQIKPEVCANGQLLRTVSKHTYAQLWTLKVSQNRNRAAQLYFNPAYDFVANPDLVMTSVAHVQTKNVCTSFVQSLDRLIIVRCRTKGCYDFYISLAFHACSPDVFGAMLAVTLPFDLIAYFHSINN